MNLRTTSVWVLRFLAIAAIGWFLARQLTLDDALELRDGEVLVGRVEAVEGGWRVDPADGGPPRAVPSDAVALRGEGARGVPAVSWGLATLGRRLGGRLEVVVLVLVLFAALIVLTAWRWQLLLDTVAIPMTFGRATRLTFIGAFFNLAVPGSTGGDVVKAWYAARGTPRGMRAVISVLVDRVIGLVGLAVFAGLVLLVAPPRAGHGPATWVVVGVLGATLVGSVVLLDRRLRRRVGLSWLSRRLPFQRLQAEVRAALRLYRTHPLALLVAMGISLVNHGAIGFGVWLLADALGIRGLELGSALALVPVANLLSAIPLVPGGWGVGELAFAWLFGAVGIPPTEAVGLSVVYRLSLLAVSLPGGLLWLVWRGRPSRTAMSERVESATHALESAEPPVPEIGAPGG